MSLLVNPHELTGKLSLVFGGNEKCCAQPRQSLEYAGSAKLALPATRPRKASLALFRAIAISNSPRRIVKKHRHSGMDAGQIGRIAGLHGNAARRARDKDVPSASIVQGWQAMTHCVCLNQSLVHPTSYRPWHWIPAFPAGMTGFYPSCDCPTAAMWACLLRARARQALHSQITVNRALGFPLTFKKNPRNG